MTAETIHVSMKKEIRSTDAWEESGCDYNAYCDKADQIKKYKLLYILLHPVFPLLN